MGNFFINKFQDKSNEELLGIIENKDRYEIDAVNAAIQILNDRDKVDRPYYQPPSEPRVVEKTDRSHSSSSFNADAFFRTLGYQDFLTSFTLALTLLAIYLLLGYYASEEWLEDIWNRIRIVSFLIVLSLNHIIYRIDHKRSNNFVGRVIHDIIFLIFFFLSILAYGYLLSHDNDLFFTITIKSVAQFVGTGLVVVIFLMFYELIIALLKRLLNLVKWRIF